jgi:hypothetical protein
LFIDALSGLTFESTASEGAILTMPEGADSENLRNRLRVQTYIGTHVKDWYKFVNGPCGREARNGDLHVVVGHDKSTSWGMATFSNSSLSKDTSFRLKFSAVESQQLQPGAVNNYTWEHSGVAEVRVGPGPGENKGLGGTDSDRLQNQCLFIRSLHVMLTEKAWKEVFPQTVVADQKDFHSEIEDQSTSCLPGSSTGYAAPQSPQSYSPQNLSSRSHNFTSSASSHFISFPENSGTLNGLLPVLSNPIDLFFEDLLGFNMVPRSVESGEDNFNAMFYQNAQGSGSRMKYVAPASRIADEDTSKQISSGSDASSTSSEYEEIQCDPTPVSDVILTYSSSCNVGVFRTRYFFPLCLTIFVGRFASISDNWPVFARTGI